MMQYYRMGGMEIVWDSEDIQIPDDNFSEKFIQSTHKHSPDIVFQAKKMDMELVKNARVLEKTGGYELLRTDAGLFVLNHWGTSRFAYGVKVSELFAQTSVPVYFGKDFHQQVPLPMTRFLSTIGLHSKLLQAGAPVIHASYISVCGYAVLFTAPAQTGKSTQSRLWQEHAEAKVINGDRVLLRSEDTGWKAYGYPCCGSSDICENETFPVACIVMLSQAQTNYIQELTLSEKIRGLVSAMELYPWEPRELDLAFALAQEIVQQVSVVRLCCRPDAEAVAVLKNYLEENGYVHLD